MPRRRARSGCCPPARSRRVTRGFTLDENRHSTKQKRGSTIFLAILAVIGTALIAGAIGVWARVHLRGCRTCPTPPRSNRYNEARTTTILASDETTVLAEFPA